MVVQVAEQQAPAVSGGVKDGFAVGGWTGGSFNWLELFGLEAAELGFACAEPRGFDAALVDVAVAESAAARAWSFYISVADGNGFAGGSTVSHSLARGLDQGFAKPLK